MVSAKVTFSCVIAFLSSAVVLQGCGSGAAGSSTTTTTSPGGDNGDNTIPGVAEKRMDLSTLVKALQVADLVSTLEGSGPFTVFAPSDDAFKKLPKAALVYLLHKKDKLTDVLEHHVSLGYILSNNLTSGEKIKMLKGGDLTVSIAHMDGNDTVKVDDAVVRKPNLIASNGVVHIIDKVLIPKDFTAPKIPALATAANLSTLVTALKAANLVDALSGEGPLTVFAPTNEAFGALPPGVLQALLKPENIQDLAKVLTYHVAEGEVLAADLKNGQHIKTLEGQDVNITISGSQVSVNQAKVIQADVFAVNGVVHVINEVLLPPGFTPPSATYHALKSPSVTLV
jgi:uncharacterized surface protein with fasciclin (FAS1) repeats